MSLKTTQINSKYVGIKTSRTKVLITSNKVTGLRTQVVKQRYGRAERIKTANVSILRDKYGYQTRKNNFRSNRMRNFTLNTPHNKLNGKSSLLRKRQSNTAFKKGTLDDIQFDNIHEVGKSKSKTRFKGFHIARKINALNKLENGDREEMQTDFVTRNGKRAGVRATKEVAKNSLKFTNSLLNRIPFVKTLKRIMKRAFASVLKMFVIYILPLVLAVVIIYLPVMGAVSTVTSIFGSGDQSTSEKYDDYIKNKNLYWDTKLEIAIADNSGLEVVASSYSYTAQSIIDWRALLAVTQAYFINNGITAQPEEFALLNEFSDNGLMQEITITDTQIIISAPSLDDVVNYILDTRNSDELDESFIELVNMLYSSSDLLSNLDPINIRNSGIGSWTTSIDGYIIRTTRPSYNDPRWYSNNSPFYRMINDSGTHYLINECTWYAYGRGSEILGITNFEEILGNGHFVRDAGTWFADNATMQRQGSGFNSSTNINEPKVGAIFVLSQGDNPGHVGIIEAVNEDGTVNISHGGQSLGGFQYVENIRLDTYFSTYSFVGYIYLIE